MFTVAIGSSFYSSIIHSPIKAEIVTPFDEFDEFISRVFSIRLDKFQINQRTQQAFVIFWLLTMSSALLFVVQTINLPTPIFVYTVQVVVLNHIVHLQTFKMFIFARGVQNRLKIILDKCSKSEESQIGDLQDAIIKLYEVNQKFNRCFKYTLLLNLLQIYLTVLINFYWQLMALLGAHSATTIGKTFNDFY